MTTSKITYDVVVVNFSFGIGSFCAAKLMIAMLKETRQGVVYPLPLVELQRRIDSGKECGTEMGGCSCFAGDE
jgi:hypothetical protein